MENGGRTGDGKRGAGVVTGKTGVTVARVLEMVS